MKGFRKYYGQKILWYIFTLIIAVILNFILPRLMPGDPTSAIVAQAAAGMTDATAVQKVLEEYTAKFGLDQPIDRPVLGIPQKCGPAGLWPIVQPVPPSSFGHYRVVGRLDGLPAASGNHRRLGPRQPVRCVGGLSAGRI